MIHIFSTKLTERTNTMKKFISTLIAASILSASIITPVQAASFGRSSSPSPSRPTNTTKPAQPPQQSNFSQNQSWGMQRPQVTQQVQTNQAPKPTQPVQPVAPVPATLTTQNKPTSSGMSPVTAGVLGTGAGLLLGTAIGSAMASPTQPPVQQPAQTVTVPNPYTTSPNLSVQPQVSPSVVQQTPVYQPIVTAPQQPTTVKTDWASFWDGIFGLIWFVIILALAVIGWIFYRNRSKVKSVKDAKDIMVHEFNQADLSKPAWKPESKLSVTQPSIEPKIFDVGVNRAVYSEKKKAHDVAMDVFIKIQTAFNQCDRNTLEKYVSPEGYHLFEDMHQADFNASIKMPHINITCDVQDDGSESGIISAWFTAFDTVTGIPVNEIWHIKDGKLMGVTQN